MYDHTDIELGLPDVGLSLVQISNDQFEIHMDNNSVVSGFQFDIDDNPCHCVSPLYLHYYSRNSCTLTETTAHSTYSCML